MKEQRTREPQENSPLADWDKQEKQYHPLLVFWERVDNRYQVEVQRIGEGSETGRGGTLLVFDHQNEDKLLLKEGVSLSYGAQFGPDESDVDQWEKRVIKFIDEELPRI